MYSFYMLFYDTQMLISIMQPSVVPLENDN